jgi:hypothetical protein
MTKATQRRSEETDVLNSTDLGECYGLSVENGVLNHGKPLANPDSRR